MIFVLEKQETTRANQKKPAIFMLSFKYLKVCKSTAIGWLLFQATAERSNARFVLPLLTRFSFPILRLFEMYNRNIQRNAFFFLQKTNLNNDKNEMHLFSRRYFIVSSWNNVQETISKKYVF